MKQSDGRRTAQQCRHAPISPGAPNRNGPTKGPSRGDTVEHLLKFALTKERRETEFLTESAEVRYRMLFDSSPELFDKVTQKDIARYLGITPVALTRIRNRSRAD